MAEERGRERDLVLAPNEYAYIQDQTKGMITTYVGPTKSSLSNTDQPVVFDEKTKKFLHCELNKAIQLVATAPEGWYVILKNPTRDNKHPSPGSPTSTPEMLIGHKVNVHGPASFPLWPGQMAKVVQGHRLRSNEYLVVRVYDEEAARASKASELVSLKQQSPEPGSDPVADATKEAKSVDLTMGRQFIIKGTDVSFFIPPTGLEVVKDASNNGNYARNAVTLERLEYCILLDEDGNKRYVRGPDVVFPSPTENFVKGTNKEGSPTFKFNATELNENSGIYVKVIDAYEENGVKHHEGEELFITGKDTTIYFPRQEHATIKYNNGQGKQDVHFAIAIPSGDGRYVLNRNTGEIKTVLGPIMLLPDPRYEVPVRRALSDDQCDLYYPGNAEVKEHNRNLRGLSDASKQANSDPKQVARVASALESYSGGDEFNRRSGFTPPRTISLDSTKYDGAVAINVWPGYAVQVVKKSGERRVVKGPNNILLQYDETLEVMELSTGKPKSDGKLMRAAYLKTLSNVVSDIVEVETSDLCKASVRLSYRVNFEDESNKWFVVENYVKFMTQHLRSLIRNTAKQHGIEEFYANAADIVRNRVLGTASEPGKPRPGRSFGENGMRIYDVEVLGVTFEDNSVAALLVESHRNAVKQSLTLKADRLRLEATQEKERIDQGVALAQAETAKKRIELDAENKKMLFEVQTDNARKQLELNMAQLEAQVRVDEERLKAKLDSQKPLDDIASAELARDKASRELEQAFVQKDLANELERLKAEAEALVAKAGAISPDLIAALQAFGDKALMEKVSAACSPLAMMGGKSVKDVLAQFFKGTPLEEIANLKGRANGSGVQGDEARGN
jgi:major vault protein